MSACRLSTKIPSLQSALVAFAFMNAASKEAYIEVFEALREQKPAIRVTEYMGDYDAAMRAAVRNQFPEAIIRGCLFHYAQCLVKRASLPSVGLTIQIRRAGKVHRRFLALLCLASLPPDMIEATFEDCAREAMAASSLVSCLLPSIEIICSITLLHDSRSYPYTSTRHGDNHQ